MYTINKRDLQFLLKDKEKKVKKNAKKEIKEKAYSEGITYTTHSIISCEGEGDSLGHPKIYLNLEEGSVCICPYCLRRFKSITEDVK